jgi:hypothetical protein
MTDSMEQSAVPTVEDQLSGIVFDLRNGYRMMLEHRDGFSSKSIGTDLETIVADRLEASIGCRRIKNEDGSISLLPWPPESKNQS